MAVVFVKYLMIPKNPFFPSKVLSKKLIKTYAENKTLDHYLNRTFISHRFAYNILSNADSRPFVAPPAGCYQPLSNLLF